MPPVRSARRPALLLAAIAVAAAGSILPASLRGAEGTAPVEWSYEGATGPEHWGSLSPDYAACATGEAQSPIDIPVDAPTLAKHPAFAYVPAPATLVDNGHAIQVGVQDAGTMTVDGRTYELRQFHLHSPSEHTIGGEGRAMELHLVHGDETGSLAVVGVLIVEGAENAALPPIWEALPSEVGVPVALADPVDATALLPVDRSTIAYPGSLTTPPCTEGVAWHVLAAPLEMSAEQIATYRAIHDGTNRPTQPFGDRVLEGP